ncbi:hypothetical protein B5P43_31785 [Bacillus sp. SRB_336]|nr:hypothetical protein B5P43_31785 [Bacillus sp. SRB_336]
MGWNDSCVHFIGGRGLRRVIEGRQALITDVTGLELKPGKPTVTSTGPDIGGPRGGLERFHYGTAQVSPADDSEWRWALACEWCGDRLEAGERKMQRALAGLAQMPGLVCDLGQMEGLARPRISGAMDRGWDVSKRVATAPLSQLEEDTDVTGVAVELRHLSVPLKLLRRALEHAGNYR